MQLENEYTCQFYQFASNIESHSNTEKNHYRPLVILLEHFAVIISMSNWVDCHCEWYIAQECNIL